jgi:hypothetical protein
VGHEYLGGEISPIVWNECLTCWQAWSEHGGTGGMLDPELFECDRESARCFGEMPNDDRHPEDRFHLWVRNMSFAECVYCDAHVAGV